MRFLYNAYNPNHPRFKYRENWPRPESEFYDRRWAIYIEEMKKAAVGLPKASSDYTVEQMLEMGIVGVYEKTEEREQK